MPCRAHRLTSVGVIVAVLLSGCNPGHFRAETTLHGDGSIERAIYQPVDQTPEAAQEVGRWESQGYVKRIPPEEWTGSIRGLQLQSEIKEKPPYFAAWGRFEDTASLGNHFENKVDHSHKTGRLISTHDRRDLGFVVEHRWTETLTEIVTLSDVYAAQAELATLTISVFHDILKEGLGDDYDVSDLIAWLETDGTAWFRQSLDAYIEINVRNHARSDDEFKKRFEELAAQYGLASLQNDAFPQFVGKKLRELLRRTDGKPLEEAVVQSILELLGLRQESAQPGETLLKLVAEKVVERRFGSREEFDRALAILGTRIQGLYGPLRLPAQFRYSMSVPGNIVETNGTMGESDNVEWSFDSRRAYPFGFSMSCRSLEPVEEAQRKLLGKPLLTHSKTMLRYVELLEADPELPKVIARCIAAGDLNALHDYRTQLSLANETDKHKNVVGLWGLLELTN